MSVCPYVLLSFCLSGSFLGIVSLVFSKFWDGARNLYEVVHDRQINVCPQNCKDDPKTGQKQDFLNLLKNVVINFCWICSIMKMYIIWCVPAQIPFLGKFLFLRYGPKCSQPVKLQDFLISLISRTSQ